MEEYKFLSFNYNTIITKDISDIHRYLIKESRYKIILGFIKKKIELLSAYKIVIFLEKLASNSKEPIKSKQSTMSN